MDQLWAPWRLSYVTQPAKPKTGDGCFICRGLAESDDRANLIAERTGRSVVVLNRFPYNTGHLLVAPTAHKAGLDDLTDDESLDLQRTLRRMVGALKSLLKPDGFNVGLNLGEAAGAGLPGHLHWHVVPRWAGDTNFMPVLADVKVMVQSLDVFWERLRAELAKG